MTRSDSQGICSKSSRCWLLAVAPLLSSGAFAREPSLAVRFSSELRATEQAPLAGRLVVILAASDHSEPRFQVRGDYRTAQLFGRDVEAADLGQPLAIDDRADGHPLGRLSDLPPGRYFVQAVLHRYERVVPSHGKPLLLPWDRGEGQQWNLAPGNLLSKPRWIDWPAERLELELEQRIAPIPEPQETRWIRHVRIRSERLSRFWGRDVFLGAFVLLPEGFEEQPEARYPLMIFHGHFPDSLGGFREEPPDPSLPCKPSERFKLPCYNRTVQEEAHRFYRLWTSKEFPRFLAIEIQHPTPYYDDSYAVNSENNGPYGDALTYELIPEIERRFRGIGEPWARFLYGGSTGGWEALAAQIFYPKEYNGAFGACPDPIDFRAFMLVDLYGEPNAYRRTGPFATIEIPAHRNWLGQVTATMAMENGMERALGSRGRSGGQFDGWQSVYSPRGEDGYPKPIFDKTTGAIDPGVAAYWRDHYDLAHIVERDWATLAPDLRGKLFVFVGDMDNYYLNNAVYLFEERVQKLSPPAEFEIAYGDRFEHCWNGRPDLPNAISRLRYHEIYLDRIARRIEATAPPQWDVSGWRRGQPIRLRQPRRPRPVATSGP